VRTFKIGLNVGLNNFPSREQAVRLLQMPPLPALGAVELPNLINNCVAACSGLESLQLHLGFPPPLAKFIPGSWVADMPSLQTLTLCVFSSPVLLLNTLESMTSLAKLAISASHGTRLGPAAELPQSLTRLAWIRDTAMHMPAQVSGASLQATTSPLGMPHLQAQPGSQPAHARLARKVAEPKPPRRGACVPQVGRLTNLVSLQLGMVSYEGGNFEGLRHLRSLRHLELEACQIPGCLSQLTMLTALVVRQPQGHDIAASLDDALCSLTQLTSLGLELDPAALAALRQLQKLKLYVVGQAAAAWNPAWSLPTGPWQRSLQQLNCSFQLAASSPDFLRGAERLREMISPDTPNPTACEGPAQFAAFWGWVYRHASLTSLVIPLSAPTVSSALFQTCLRATAERPGLKISILDARQPQPQGAAGAAAAPAAAPGPVALPDALQIAHF
jgi:hypothetical protein